MSSRVLVLAVIAVFLAGCARGPEQAAPPASPASASGGGSSSDNDEDEETEEEDEETEDEDEETEDEDEDEPEGEEVSIFRVRVGDCFDDPDGEEIREVVVISCDEPHDNEVYGLVELDDDDDFPGENQVAEEAEELCFEEFEDYVGIPYEESVFLSLQLTPTEEGWEDGDREAVCVLYDADQDKLDESAEGSRD